MLYITYMVFTQNALLGREKSCLAESLLQYFAW